MNRTELRAWIKKEVVLVVATILAIGSSFFTGLHSSHVDFNVLMLLFNLMLVVVALEKLQVLDYLSTFILKYCQNRRQLTMGLMSLTFFMAMIITNDVALITFVPLALIVTKASKINPIKLIVILTIAANLGSSLTPIGNPQNLYLYSYFQLSAVEFFTMMMPLGVVSFIFLSGIVLLEKPMPIEPVLKEVKIEHKKSVYYYLFLLTISLLSVFHVIPISLAFVITVVLVFIEDRRLFKKVDYALLLTFIAFFIFIGNISSIPQLSTTMEGLLQNETRTYAAGILSSQIISNVPAAILLASFTPYVKALLLGVNIGGLGTLIASLASVISYKLFVDAHPTKGGQYLKTFTLYNVIFLVCLMGIFIFLI